MKKSFYFALALTAGLFASCSSDELTSQAPAGLDVNDNEAAQILIGIANPGVTRGTGTVGSTTTANKNYWAGQKFNLFMFKKNTVIAATKVVNANDVAIYDNAVMTTPDNEGQAAPYATAASYVIGEDEQFNYYPTTGSYSFWAYRADDAADKDNNGDPIVVYKDANDQDVAANAVDETTAKVLIPFTIDGSQDIMLAVPDTTADMATLTTAVGAAKATNKIYTAYSSRRNINPTLTFKHALTRLTFQVKAATGEVSDAARKVNQAVDYSGFKVTGISIKSLNTGNIIAASIIDDPNQAGKKINGAQSVVFNTVDANNTALAPVAMDLKSRARAVTHKLTGEWSTNSLIIDYAADGTPTLAGTFTFANSANVTVNTGELVVYTSNEVDDYTGKPIAEGKTLNALCAEKAAATNPAAAGSVTVYSFKSNNDYAEDPDPTKFASQSSLLTKLIPVVPEWDITGTGGAPATVVEKQYTVYATDAAVQAWADAAAANAEEYVYRSDLQKFQKVTVTTAAAGGNPAVTTTVDVYDGTVDEVDDYAKIATIMAPSAEKGKTYFKVNDGTNPVAYYEEEVTVASTGVGKKTDIGEALLVAPADKYDMTVTYKRYKKTTSGAGGYSEIEGTVNSVVSLGLGNGDFEAGKSYNIVITLYKDGDATADTNLTPWDEHAGDIEIDGEE